MMPPVKTPPWAERAWQDPVVLRLPLRMRRRLHARERWREHLRAVPRCGLPRRSRWRYQVPRRIDERLRRFMAPRSEWGDGPWQDEPDHVEWTHEASGYPLVMVRGPQGSWCGYVGVPKGHPFHLARWTYVEDVADTRAHGGLTYSGPTGHLIHHARAKSNVWWLGFDCGHVSDFSPAMEALVRRVRGPGWDHREDLYDAVRSRDGYRDDYRDIETVRGLVEALADNLLAADRQFVRVGDEVRSIQPPPGGQQVSN